MATSRSRPRRQPLNSVATKIILFVFSSTFATAAVVSWISIHSTHRHILEVLDRHYRAAAWHAAESLGTAVRDAQAQIETLAAADGFAAAAQRGRVSPDVERQLVESIVNGPLDGLALVGGSGAPLAAVGSAGPLPPAAWPQLLERARGGGGPTPLAEPLQGALAFSIETGGGALVGVVSRARISKLLEAQEPDASAEVLLVDGGGRVLVRSGSRDDAGGTLPLARLLSPPGVGAHEYTATGGTHVIGSASAVGLLDWHLAIEAPFSEAFRPVLELVTQIFVIDLCIILAFSLLAYKITEAVLRPIEKLSHGARRIAQGELDVEVPEPRAHDEIGLLTRIFNDMVLRLRRDQAEIAQKNRRLEEQNARLQQANEVLNQLSITDGLTKLHNHRFFQDHLTREIKRVHRSQEPLSILLVDIDDFKQLNDRLGHAAGDELLSRIARVMNSCVRESDLLARYGGEEFVILASGTDLQGAYRLAEKIRTAIAETSFILDDSLRPIRVTVSVGVAEYSGNRKRFFQCADRALYRAKAEGKNCVVVDDEDGARERRDQLRQPGGEAAE